MLARWSRHAPALVAYLALTVALTWPLVLNLGERVPHDLGDPLLSTWVLWWNARVVPFSEGWWNGAFFFPSPNTLTFSDHRVGLGVITSPIIWAGGSPLTAYNVAFLLSFVLSAIGAYALCFVLTRSRAAAFAGGLVFGFHPFRAAHLAHLELLASYWLPVVLLALHKWIQTQRPSHLIWLAVALTMQGLTSGYYFFFGGVLLALWLVWFRLPAWSPGQYARLAMALIAPLIVLAPILYKYHQSHAALGLSRSINDIELLSADLIGFLSAPEELAFWNTPDAWKKAEGSLMPGLTATLVVVLGVCARRWRAGLEHRSVGWRRARIACLVGGLLAAAVALIPSLFGPVSLEWGPVRLSVSAAYKPLSIGALLIGCWLLTSSTVRQAWRRQSVFGFYVLATIAMCVFALGPTARLLGERMFYKAPYSWLMLLPGFRDGFRVPARFAMLAALTLAVAAAVALTRLVRGRPVRIRAAAAAVMSAGVLVDSWIRPFPLVPPPTPLELPASVPPGAVIVEFPLAPFEDAAAMYRAIGHGHPVANGLSGYGPPHYAILQSALEEGSTDVLTALAVYADLAVFLPRDGGRHPLAPLVEAHASAPPAATATHDVFVIPRSSVRAGPARETDSRPQIPVQRLVGAPDPRELASITDGNRRTARLTSGAQRGDEELTVDLGAAFEVSGLILALGAHAGAYPRALVIDVSEDGAAWVEAWRGSGAARSVAAAIEDPLELRVVFDFAPRSARYVRVRQTGRTRDSPWGISELRVMGSPVGR